VQEHLAGQILGVGVLATACVQVAVDLAGEAVEELAEGGLVTVGDGTIDQCGDQRVFDARRAARGGGWCFRRAWTCTRVFIADR
jgi:hypothetical protein